MPQIFLPFRKPIKANHRKRVSFHQKILLSDNSYKDLKSYCMVLEPTKFDRARVVYDFDISIKELSCLKSCV